MAFTGTIWDNNPQEDNLNNYILLPTNRRILIDPFHWYICRSCGLSFTHFDFLQDHYRTTYFHGRYIGDEFYKRQQMMSEEASRQQYDQHVMEPSVPPPVNSSTDIIPERNSSPSPLQQNTSQPPTTSYSQHQQLHSQAQSSEISTQIQLKEQRPISLCDSENCEASSVKQKVSSEVNKTQGYIEKIQKSIPTSELSDEDEVDFLHLRLMHGVNIRSRHRLSPKGTRDGKNLIKPPTETVD